MFLIRADQVEKEIVHQTGAVYWLIPEGSMRADTDGSFFDFVSEFTLQPGSQLEPHYHDTFEFYYVLEGEAIMQIEMEAHVVVPGDLIRIDRNARHSIWPTEGNTIRCLCVATSFRRRGSGSSLATCRGSSLARARSTELRGGLMPLRLPPWRGFGGSSQSRV